MLSAIPALAQGFLQIVNLKANHWATLSNRYIQVGTEGWRVEEGGTTTYSRSAADTD
jgi:hypothetical protein